MKIVIIKNLTNNLSVYVNYYEQLVLVAFSYFKKTIEIELLSRLN